MSFLGTYYLKRYLSGTLINKLHFLKMIALMASRTSNKATQLIRRQRDEHLPIIIWAFMSVPLTCCSLKGSTEYYLDAAARQAAVFCDIRELKSNVNSYQVEPLYIIVSRTTLPSEKSREVDIKNRLQDGEMAHRAYSRPNSNYYGNESTDDVCARPVVIWLWTISKFWFNQVKNVVGCLEELRRKLAATCANPLVHM